MYRYRIPSVSAVGHDGLPLVALGIEEHALEDIGQKGRFTAGTAIGCL